MVESLELSIKMRMLTIVSRTQLIMLNFIDTMFFFVLLILAFSLRPGTLLSCLTLNLHTELWGYFNIHLLGTWKLRCIQQEQWTCLRRNRQEWWWETDERFVGSILCYDDEEPHKNPQDCSRTYELLPFQLKETFLLQLILIVTQPRTWRFSSLKDSDQTVRESEVTKMLERMTLENDHLWLGVCTQELLRTNTYLYTTMPHVRSLLQMLMK